MMTRLFSALNEKLLTNSWVMNFVPALTVAAIMLVSSPSNSHIKNQFSAEAATTTHNITVSDIKSPDNIVMTSLSMSEKPITSFGPRVTAHHKEQSVSIPNLFEVSFIQKSAPFKIELPSAPPQDPVLEVMRARINYYTLHDFITHKMKPANLPAGHCAGAVVQITNPVLVALGIRPLDIVDGQFMPKNLEKSGYATFNPNRDQGFKTGDMAWTKPTADFPNGHISTYDRKKGGWVSDFAQNGVYVFTSEDKITFYRNPQVAKLTDAENQMVVAAKRQLEAMPSPPQKIVDAMRTKQWGMTFAFQYNYNNSPLSLG